MKVLVNGVGNIGTTLACLLFKFKDDLNISEVIVFKNKPQPWRQTDLNFLTEIGISVKTSAEINFNELITKVDYVFETTANEIGLKNKHKYEKASNLIGACAQGSEKEFGLPFMSGIKNDHIQNQKFVQIVSCNTHGAATILQTLCNQNLSNLKSADFVVVRRSEDLGNHERLVTANVIARHLSPITGTHHAIDVKDMFNTINLDCNITSSDITTPSQLMHSTRFNIDFNTEISPLQIETLIQNNLFLSTTTKFDSNLIFELGRRYGIQGRIYNHAIILTNNLIYTKKSVKGWAFVPQEGNTLISTIHAFLLQTQSQIANQIISTIQNQLLLKKW